MTLSPPSEMTSFMDSPLGSQKNSKEENKHKTPSMFLSDKKLKWNIFNSQKSRLSQFNSQILIYKQPPSQFPSLNKPNNHKAFRQLHKKFYQRIPRNLHQKSTNSSSHAIQFLIHLRFLMDPRQFIINLLNIPQDKPLSTRIFDKFSRGFQPTSWKTENPIYYNLSIRLRGLFTQNTFLPAYEISAPHDFIDLFFSPS